ncbi:MAG: DNA (cytosine-5-)-methyltransferase [Planctomycetia bacterium]
MPRTRRNKPRFIDLFCGIGGFHYAFEAAGAECVWACDWDQHARETYAANHGMQPWSDIRKARLQKRPRHGRRVRNDTVPAHDILCAGFPCQPFSIAGVSKKTSLGRKHGFEDEVQGNLFWEILRILRRYRPRAFVLENVKNLTSHDGKRTFTIIKSSLERLGYHVHHEVLDAKPYVPQHRERIFIVGFKVRTPFKFPAQRPPAGRRRPVLRDILDSKVASKYTLTPNLWKYLQAYAAKHARAGNGFGYGLVGRGDVARTLSARYGKDGSEILIKQRGNRPRRLTPTECRRLMGFPGTFIPHPSDARAYKQFGNSVVVPVVHAVAKRVIKALHRASSMSSGRVIRRKAVLLRVAAKHRHVADRQRQLARGTRLRARA